MTPVSMTLNPVATRTQEVRTDASSKFSAAAPLLSPPLPPLQILEEVEEDVQILLEVEVLEEVEEDVQILEEAEELNAWLTTASHQQEIRH